ncbi:MAG: RidA family protein [Actinobacteria bacterium]|nr:RidA family protein [Actinomycetota bacterium]
MAQTIINPPDGPPHGGPYSHGIRVGDMVFTAGQGPFNAAGELVGDDVAAQTEVVLDNIERILAEAGATLDDVVRVTAHLQDLKGDFAAYNEVYARRFGDHRPCRTTVGSTLGGFLVEIDVIAIASSGG